MMILLTKVAGLAADQTDGTWRDEAGRANRAGRRLGSGRGPLHPSSSLGENVMNRRSFLAAIAAAAACPTCAGMAQAEGAHWSYEGAAGPGRWSALDKASATCGTGTRQSPLDIVEPVKAQLAAMKVDYKPAVADVENNGHTIQVNVAPGSTMTVGGTVYNLVQFHFHRPSEHMIAGKSFPMELHFVHKTAAGALGVLGVMLTVGAANPSFGAITQAMPAKPGKVTKGLAAIDPNGMLPAARTYYKYAGSLTTPPCSEDVDWHLLTDPVSVSAEQVAAFAKLYALNARPTQKGFKRFVLVSE
jgi:carbonic anhydrase